MPFDCVLETVLVPTAQEGNVKLGEGLAKGHLAPALGLHLQPAPTGFLVGRVD